MFRATKPPLRPKVNSRMEVYEPIISSFGRTVDMDGTEIATSDLSPQKVNPSPPSACTFDRPIAATLRHRSIVSQVSGPPFPASMRILPHPAGVHDLLPCRLGTSPGNPVPAYRVAGPLPARGQSFALAAFQRC